MSVDSVTNKNVSDALLEDESKINKLLMESKEAAQNYYCSSQANRDVAMLKSTNQMFNSKVTYLNSRVNNKQVRPNTANYFKLKEPLRGERNNSYMNKDNKSPSFTKASQHASKRQEMMRLSKESRRNLGLSFGSELANPKRFTINDLADV